MNYLIETIALTKRYKQQFAVNAVNLKVKSGEIYGLLGRIDNKYRSEEEINNG